MRRMIRLPLSFMVALVIVPSVGLSQAPPVRVELICRVPDDPDSHDSGQFAVEVRSPAGEILERKFTFSGRTVRFKGLSPQIVTVCLIDLAGRRSCRSVDLYPAPKVSRPSFAVDLKLPDYLEESLYLVSQAADLVVPPKARREFEKSLVFRMRGRQDEAVRHLERAIEIHSGYVEALTNLGTFHFLSGDRARAEELYRKAALTAPYSHASWLNLGIVLLLAGDPEAALAAEMRAVELSPNDAFVNYQVGLCHYALGEFAEAKRRFGRTAELDPASATYPQVYLARIALMENQPDLAESLLHQIFELHPYSPWPSGMKETVEWLAAVKKSRTPAR